MFYFFSKALDFLLSPLFWILLGLAILVWKNRAKKTGQTILLRLTFIALLFFSNPFTINLLLLWWEVPPTPLREIKEPYDIGIVLTGITEQAKSPEDRIYFHQGADRIIHALMLYRKGKIRKILITGGNAPDSKWKSEAAQLATFLTWANVPKEVIIIEDQARNTRQNALFTEKIITTRYPNESLLLITSAFHMRRARGCFQKVDLKVVPFSAGFFTSDLQYTGVHSFLPSESALYYWFIFVHELAGYVVYWLVGYL